MLAGWLGFAMNWNTRLFGGCKGRLWRLAFAVEGVLHTGDSALLVAGVNAYFLDSDSAADFSEQAGWPFIGKGEARFGAWYLLNYAERYFIDTLKVMGGLDWRLGGID